MTYNIRKADIFGLCQLFREEALPMLNTEQKVVSTVIFGLAFVLVAIAYMYPVQNIIAASVLGKITSR